ncbi:MAG TPA: DNA mismatch repair protein MutS [Myxococcota bacterium]|nr:DNA mismatch repair protein MutS [Myxococcota bacterium]HQK50298.1 DNA mismatch repair protein MutS [Myxococcota bacterium]
MGAETTPSMQQYLAAKAEHPDCILLFRMGDFYETFFEDAVEVSRLLDLTLTSRNKDDPNPIPMAGVPYHALHSYLLRLLDAGRKVAICEQMEDPRQAKGLVRREVVRVVTPGVLLDTEIEDPGRPNHLFVVLPEGSGFALAVVDASTGDFRGAVLPSRDLLLEALHRLAPRELLVPPGGLAPDVLPAMPSLAHSALEEADLLEDRLPADLLPLLPDREPHPGLRRAATALLSYLGRTHPALRSTIRPFRPLWVSSTARLPPTTARNLELMESALGGRQGPSLLRTLDRTRTAMGSRLLRSRLLAPLTDLEEIGRRLDQIEALVRTPLAREAIQEALRGVSDIERILTRLAAGAGNARDLRAVARGIEALQAAARVVREASITALDEATRIPPTLPDLAVGLLATFVEDPPSTVKDGGLVRRGIRQDLDEALDMAENGRQYIARYEAQERARTGIATLRIRYHRVFGYTIEVSRSQADRVPPEYQRRQTLAGAERYTTPELSRLEDQVATAEERSREIQQAIFEEWRSRILAARSEVQALADSLALLDLAAALGEVAQQHSWCRPVVHSGREIHLREARHPLVEASLPPGTFVPNDIDLDGVQTTMILLTGPNMAGKSTVMRQVAVAAILAQVGSFVPAREARLGIADAFFTRVGAMDDLASGRSTFMVEMSEVSEILSRATDRSLVILDEIGRGTSTFDGVAIAWAVAEHLQERIGCRTFFATHYHEMTDLVRVLPRVRNQSVAVKEWGGEVLFLRRLVDGPASKSYGIQVARLAGLPGEVLARAREVLANLESVELDATGRPVLGRSRRQASARRTVVAQMDLFGTPLPDDPGPAPVDPLVHRLARLDPERLTPLEAIQALSDLVTEARKRVPPAAPEDIEGRT